MSDTYSFFADLAAEAEMPEDGILSRPIFNNDTLRVVLFAMSPGQELTEHTTSMEAVLYFVKGSAQLTLGTDPKQAQAGTWVRMEPRLPHSIKAEEPLVMLLVLLKAHKAGE
ncbi:MAG: cupin domain-containing protein [Candidatus Hydrogenedentes bacterium]|nr:cupin domain-containing protein [Candidatus Hydrogenedentota bacterium]